MSVGLLALLTGHLLVPDDRELTLCTVFGSDCRRAYAYYGLAISGWLLLLVGVMTLIVTGMRRLRSGRTRASTGRLLASDGSSARWQDSRSGDSGRQATVVQ